MMITTTTDNKTHILGVPHSSHQGDPREARVVVVSTLLSC